MTIYQLQTIYVTYALILALIGLGLTIYTLFLAYSRRRQELVMWLLPTLAAHIVSLTCLIYVLVFRWLGLQTTVVTTTIALTGELISGLIGLYAQCVSYCLFALTAAHRRLYLCGGTNKRLLVVCDIGKSGVFLSPGGTFSE